MSTILITGGNAGIGLATATSLAQQGHSAIITSRNLAKGNEAAQKIKTKTGVNVDVIALDLSSQASVRQAATEILAKYTAIDVLINNAGCYFSDLTINHDGLEMQFATNHLGHFLLTHLLMDRIMQSPDPRVINLASIAHQQTRSINFNDINYSQSAYSGWGSYSRSKFCNILTARELAARYGGQGLMAFSIHPGGVRTEIAEKHSNWFTALGWKLAKPFFITVEQGAATSVYLATAPRAELLPHNGHYFYKCRKVNSNRPSQDMALAHELWQHSESLCGI